jgi:hypothetical protein
LFFTRRDGKVFAERSGALAAAFRLGIPFKKASL